MAGGEAFEHASLVAPIFWQGDFFDNLALFVEVDDAPDTAFGDHGVAVLEALKCVNVGTLGVVFPSDFLLQGDLGGNGPGVVKENVTVRKKLKIVVSGVTALRAAGLILPDDGSVGLADREDVFTIGCANKNEAIFFSQEGQGQKDE